LPYDGCITKQGDLRQLKNLRSKQNVLEWRALASKPSLMHLDPVIVDVRIVERVGALAKSHDFIHHIQKLLDIQRDSATAIGALAALGATVSISLMYSANRGSE